MADIGLLVSMLEEGTAWSILQGDLKGYKGAIFENLMADLAAYLVSVYDIEPRDAVGLVMNNPLTQELYSSDEPITGQEVKALAEELLSVG